MMIAFNLKTSRDFVRSGCHSSIRYMCNILDGPYLSCEFGNDVVNGLYQRIFYGLQDRMADIIDELNDSVIEHIADQLG